MAEVKYKIVNLGGGGQSRMQKAPKLLAYTIYNHNLEIQEWKELKTPAS